MRAENNKVELTGTIITEPEFNHEVFGEGFYNMHLKVDRLSGTADIIPLIISERLINLNDKYTGTAVNVSGVYRLARFTFSALIIHIHIQVLC